MGNWEIFKIIYVEDNYGNIHKRISECGINVHYETEPPHGDGIYSVTLKNKKLPFWIYGRNLIFLDAYYLLADTVEAHTWNPITSRLINIHTGESASLGDWYNNVKVKENEVELKNDFTGETMILKDVENLNWV